MPMIEKSPKAKREAPARVFVRPGEVPVGALTWIDMEDKPHQLRRWRRGIGKALDRQPRAIRLAWTLEWLFVGGYAYASNGFLAREMGIGANKVQEALALLEANGAIVRAYAFVDGRVQRRLYPAALIADQDTPERWG